VHAQSITISGKVADKETGELLGFASVGIKGKPVGTISNFIGEFDFHFSPDYKNEILVVSMIGYSNFETPIWALDPDKFQTILMTKSSVLLPEVLVVDSLSGGDILRLALSRIDQNYPKKPFMLNGFYRDIKKIGGTSISLLEAAVKIYDEDYAEPRNKYKLRERVQLIEVRRSLGYENKFTDYFDQDNLLEDLLLHNSIRYRQIDAEEELFESMIRQQDSYYDGREVYVVKRTNAYNLTFYIDKTDFSIMHMEYESGPSGEIISKKKDLVSKFSGIKKAIDFKRYNGTMYLNYMTMTSKVNWYNAKTNELKFEAELFQQLLINEVYINTKDRIASNQKMHSYSLQYQDQPYNKKFWDDYNVIKDSPLDNNTLQDLEKHLPLEEQFEQN
jgi:hypothetical protein